MVRHFLVFACVLLIAGSSVAAADAFDDAINATMFAEGYRALSVVFYDKASDELIGYVL